MLSLSSVTSCSSFRGRHPHPNSPKEPLPVEGVEKVVGQDLRSHQVVQHSPWKQAANGEGTSQPQACPLRTHSQSVLMHRHLRHPSPGFVVWGRARGPQGSSTHHTGPASGLSPRFRFGGAAPPGCPAGTSVAAHTPVGRGQFCRPLRKPRAGPPNGCPYHPALGFPTGLSSTSLGE